MSHKISCILEECEKFVECTENYPSSVGQYLQDRFEEYLENCIEDTLEDKTVKWELFQWHLRYLHVQICLAICASKIT